MKISGKFEVKMDPQTPGFEGKDGLQIGRFGLAKTFHGELSATSQGEMISAMTPVKGSAGYVAIEQVSGTLAGKKGSFALQHYGIMDESRDRLILEVIPGSGSGELASIKGAMKILRDEQGHTYEFEYSFV